MEVAVSDGSDLKEVAAGRAELLRDESGVFGLVFKGQALGWGHRLSEAAA